MARQTISCQVNVTVPAGLLILFVALKLTHVIDWSWVWVTAPAWITFGFLVLVAVAGVISGLSERR